MADTTTHVGSRLDHDHVRAHLADLRLYTPLRTLTDGQHRDHGSHADDDTQHREESPQLVVGQGPEGYL